MSGSLRGASRDFDEGADVNAADLTLLHSPVPSEQVQDGAPMASAAAFVDEERLVRLVPGSVMRLEAGQRTVWTVTQTQRKVYIT